jgi:hypothetical protein
MNYICGKKRAEKNRRLPEIEPITANIANKPQIPRTNREYPFLDFEIMYGTIIGQKTP